MKFGSKLRQAANGKFIFRCPGCDEFHGVWTRPTEKSPSWDFNGDGNAPTFSPSINVRTGHFAENRAPGNCWCDYKDRLGRQPAFQCKVCHSFVTAGRIQFLGDCTHALAGQTVDLPDIPEDKA